MGLFLKISNLNDILIYTILSEGIITKRSHVFKAYLIELFYVLRQKCFNVTLDNIKNVKINSKICQIFSVLWCAQGIKTTNVKLKVINDN